MTTHESMIAAVRLHQAGKLVEAEKGYRKILSQEPSHASALHFLGVLMHQKGDLRAATDLIRQAIAINPAAAEFRGNLGNALKDTGMLDEAIAEYRIALKLQPGLAEVHNNLGNVLLMLGETNPAIAEFRAAIAAKPSLVSAHCNLGNALRRASDLDGAKAALQEAIRLDPNYAQAYDALGHVFKDQSDPDQALASYRHAMQLRPNHAPSHSNLVYGLHFHPDYDAKAIYEEHRQWNERYAAQFKVSLKPHPNDRNPDRRLRIGYVSLFFRDHVISRFLLPIMENHDRANYEVFCYSDVVKPDPMTHRYRARADQWRDVFSHSDAQLADVIRNDRIDILVDLNMHNANRLLVFARKPAPVQITYLAYCSTTGLDAIDYRLTDPYLDPPGTDDGVYSERSLRLPETYWCYEPPADVPPVAPMPARKTGHITFGCLNNFSKVTPSAVDAWCAILQAVPKSRLILHTKLGNHRQRLLDRAKSNGVDPARVSFIPMIPQSDYFRIYDDIDIALDPFQYSGGTTSCDALWMGVPVVSRAGNTAVSRSGLSILSNIGLPELVARDTDGYTRIAIELAGNLERLEHLRATMRERMQASPLMNGPRMARHVECAYRNVWGDWCAATQDLPACQR